MIPQQVPLPRELQPRPGDRRDEIMAERSRAQRIAAAFFVGATAVAATTVYLGPELVKLGLASGEPHTAITLMSLGGVAIVAGFAITYGLAFLGFDKLSWMPSRPSE